LIAGVQLPLLPGQPVRTAAAAVYPYDPGLESQFGFITNFGDPVQMSLRHGDMLYIPRGLALIGKHDDRVVRPQLPLLSTKFEPRNPEQQPLITKAVQLLQQDQQFVFEAPTGWGKTVVGSVIAAHLRQPTMIVVHKQDLMDQWEDSLLNVLGVPASLVGRVQQDQCDWQGKRFVLGMVQSLIIPDRYPDEMYRYFGFLLLDEVHRMAADCFVNTCWMFPAKYRMGLTATPERSDGKWRVVISHIGPVRCRGTLIPMKPKVLVRKTGWKIPSRSRRVHGMLVEEKIPHEPGRMMLVIKAMAASQTRNLEIVNFVLAAYQVERRILVLSELREHLTSLFHMAAGFDVPGEDMGFYMGGMSKLALEVSKKKRVVWATYKMTSEGTDVPAWDSLVFATPRANIKQPLGRINRFEENKKQPIALDLVDYDRIFSSFYLARLKQYYSVGAQVVNV
jgi:superfamily II DNA or RNA helicase